MAHRNPTVTLIDPTESRPRRAVPAVRKTAPDVSRDGGPAADLSYIAPDLRGLAEPLDSLQADPTNARQHGDVDLAALAESLATHGQQKAVVGCRIYRGQQNVIIAGNGTMQAARRLGWSFLAVSWFTGTETEATAFAVTDNRTSELSTWNPAALASLQADGLDLMSLWHGDADLAALLGDAAVVPKFQPEDPEHRLDRLAVLHCPACGAEVPR